ncbi:MAG: Alanine--tRNA ligase [Candidatus Phytoplasma pruni]
MKKMTSSEIRKMWLNFFVEKGHYQEKSASLVPQSDPTLLWVNAGVTPLKKYFDGSEKVRFQNIVNVQKCLRNNDIENIGKTSRHNTFFEMLGNFSIGGYFKEEAIDLAYELLLSERFFALPKEKLYITYFHQDLDTYHFWLKKGIDENHLIPLKTNYWEIGEGPCGPCTEIFFDRGSEYDSRGLELIENNIENDRFIEIWNIVFSQYNSVPETKRENYKELPQKNIDTGTGLERLACIFQDKKTNFETDLFYPIIVKMEEISGFKYQEDETFRIISDHVKTLVFGLGDDVVLANYGRGYVLKRLLRRAFQKGKKIGLNQPFLYRLVPTVADMMQEFYPELKDKETVIAQMIQKEEEKFLHTLKEGEVKILELTEDNKISDENFFKLYDTYGLPKEVVLEFAEQRNIEVDSDQFDIFLQKQKKLSQKNQNKDFKNGMKEQNTDHLNFTAPSEFVGYEVLEAKTKILKVFKEGIVLEKTPFYPRMGGQSCDEGTINNVPVTKVTKLPNGQIIHQIANVFHEGQEVVAIVDPENRRKNSLNHTATHLLNDSLRKVFGKHIKQQGSSLNDKVLRYDFNHYNLLSSDDLMQLENQVNDWISQKYPVITEAMSFVEAQKKDAKFLVDKDYSDTVRVVKIHDFSLQLCGGTHAKNTMELKRFAILSYSSIGSGIYRIEATSEDNVRNAIEQKISPFVKEEQQILHKMEQDQKVVNTKIIPKIMINYNSYEDIQNYKSYVQALKQQQIAIQKEMVKKQTELILQKADQFIPDKIEKQMLIMIHDETNIEPNILKTLLEHLFDKLQNDFLILCQKQNNGFVLLVKSKTVHAGQFLNNINKIINGKGGGNKTFARSFSSDITKINELEKGWKTCL